MCSLCVVTVSLVLLSARNLGLARAADAIDVNSISVALETPEVKAVDGFFYLLRLQLGHLAAAGADLMHVVAVGMAELVGGGAGYAMPDDDAQLDEEVQRVVERCPADRKAQFVGQFSAKLVEGEVGRHGRHRIEYGITLRRLAMTVHLKKPVKNGPRLFFLFFLFHSLHFNSAKLHIFCEIEHNDV